MLKNAGLLPELVPHFHDQPRGWDGLFGELRNMKLSGSMGTQGLHRGGRMASTGSVSDSKDAPGPGGRQPPGTFHEGTGGPPASLFAVCIHL